MSLPHFVPRPSASRLGLVGSLVSVLFLVPGSAMGQSGDPGLYLFYRAAGPDPAVAEEALAEIGAHWRDGYSTIILDFMRVLRPGVPQRGRLIDFLEDRTGQSFGTDLNQWRRWMWSLPYEPHPEYGQFKASLLGQVVDVRMMEFFPAGARTTIRLDEVDWGGVPVNGIPPLEHPAHIPADEADYLDDGDVIFGISVNGEARAYPKRILAWHEMALDEIGDVELTIIYCTLCGTVLPYESEVGGQLRRFGTSGLLYRSNKLFFDEETMSLWSTLEGRPVIGDLVGEGLELRLRSSVTTTWGEWRRRHPDTTVLSIDTGFSRNYGEGVAYRDYFATDRLMFQVPSTDDRLNNKDEVLVMLIEPAEGGGEREPLAIAVDFLDENRIYPFEFAGRSFVVITSEEGANRVYETGEVRFARRDDSDRVQDRARRRWQVEEEALVGGDRPEVRLPRVTANRAFWFGWYAQFSQTQLIQ